MNPPKKKGSLDMDEKELLELMPNEDMGELLPEDKEESKC